MRALGLLNANFLAEAHCYFGGGRRRCLTTLDVTDTGTLIAGLRLLTARIW